MKILLAGFGAKIAGIGLAAGAMLFFPKIRKTLRAKLGDAIKSGLRHALIFTLDDDSEKEKEAFRAIVKAMVHYAELKVPDEGMGDKKKKAIVAYLSRFTSPKLAGLISEMIDDAVLEMDAQLKDADAQPTKK